MYKFITGKQRKPLTFFRIQYILDILCNECVGVIAITDVLVLKLI